MAKAKKTDATVDAIPGFTLSPEEMALVQRFREGVANPVVSGKSDAHRELAEAFVEAIERTKPKEKKTSFNRPRKGPFETKDGSPKPTLRRKMFHHGTDLDDVPLKPNEIELLNKVKPGLYCSGFVRVIKRKDRSLDIDYPIKTASQRLKLLNQFGIRDFGELIQRLIDEAAKPALYKEDDDD